MTETQTATERVALNRQLAQMLKGGVIMDVTTPEQAHIAEEAGACAGERAEPSLGWTALLPAGWGASCTGCAAVPGSAACPAISGLGLSTSCQGVLLRARGISAEPAGKLCGGSSSD